MRTTVEVFWGEEPANEAEKQFLAQLKGDLEQRQVPATILASFSTSGARQIDFFVFTADHACHVELKNLLLPLVGDRNGPWSSVQPDGPLSLIKRQQNPYEQTVSGRFAISDDMHNYAEATGAPAPAGTLRFYTQFHSVLCVYPNIAEGSRLPSDHKVKPLGYADFLAFLLQPGPHPSWDETQRAAFILHLGLVPARPVGSSNNTVDDARALTEEYARRFAGSYRQGLHELVDFNLIVGEDVMPSSNLSALLRSDRQVQVIGQSGTGKSHLATHTALSAARAGAVPIMVRAQFYDGRLSSLLNRSVATFTTNTAAELLQASIISDTPILVVVDGFNECPSGLGQQMLHDLSAFCLRHTTTLLITSQVAVPSTGALSPRTAQAEALSEDARRAVLTSYNAPEIIDLCQPFSTAYELSVAAECSAELTPPTTRAGLFGAYVRRRLAGVTSPATVRDVLRCIALRMDELLVTALPVDDVWRIAEQRTGDQSAPITVVDEVLRCTLTRTRQGRFSFSHELLGRVLASEALVLDHRESDALAQELRKPRHDDLKTLAVPLITNEHRIRGLLTSLADWVVLSSCLDGTLGTTAHQAVSTDARSVLNKATVSMADTKILFGTNDFAVSGGHEISPYEQALLVAVGHRLLDGAYFNEVIELLVATDAACHRSAQAQVAAGGKLSHSQIVSDICVLGQHRTQRLAAAAVIEAFRTTRHDSRFRKQHDALVEADTIETVVDRTDPGSYTVLYFLCELLRWSDVPEATRLVPRLLRLCWDSKAYHLSLDALMMAQSFCQIAEGDARDEIVSVLESFSPQNIFISSVLVEALNSYGVIDPPTTADNVTSEIQELLSGPQNAETFERAHSIVTNQFEEIFSEAHTWAIEALGREDLIALLIMAAKGGH